ncbi:unnamed protein product [Gongylonema pulchrum]|uniref:RCC1 domain-containing protein n=1 Tax=Gongylonema pulchrum TaxID=637853 RepID=A0A3P6SAK2_9BILA|nr:unnamed protein product [Gongylonema pulchrum]
MCRACGESSGMIFDRELRVAPPRASLSPCRLVLQRNVSDIKVSSVCCGNYHTVVLAADRSVFTFGSNCHGQLGIGHVRSSTGPHKVHHFLINHLSEHEYFS